MHECVHASGVVYMQKYDKPHAHKRKVFFFLPCGLCTRVECSLQHHLNSEPKTDHVHALTHHS